MTRMTIKKLNSNMAKRYELAHHKVMNDLPGWKRKAIEEDRKNGQMESRLMDEYVRAVTKIAEDESNPILTTAE